MLLSHLDFVFLTKYALFQTRIMQNIHSLDFSSAHEKSSFNLTGDKSFTIKQKFNKTITDFNITH